MPHGHHWLVREESEGRRKGSRRAEAATEWQATRRDMIWQVALALEDPSGFYHLGSSRKVYGGISGQLRS